MSVAISTRVRGRTRTSCSSGSGSCSVTVAMSLRRVRNNDFDASLRVAGGDGEGLQEGGRRSQVARWQHPCRRGQRSFRSDPFGQRDEQLGPIDGLQPRLGRRLGRTQIDDAGTVLGDDDVGGPQGAVGDAGGVQGGCLPPHRLEQVGAERFRSERVEWTAWHVLHGHDHRPVGQRGEPRGGRGSGRPPDERAAGSDLRARRGVRVTIWATRHRRRAATPSGSRDTAGRRLGCRGRRP